MTALERLAAWLAGIAIDPWNDDARWAGPALAKLLESEQWRALKAERLGRRAA